VNRGRRAIATVVFAVCLLCNACAVTRQEAQIPPQRTATIAEATLRGYMERFVSDGMPKKEAPYIEDMIQYIASDLWYYGPLCGFYALIGEEVDYYVFQNGETENKSEGNIVAIFLSRESSSYAKYTTTGKKEEIEKGWSWEILGERERYSRKPPYWTESETYLYKGTVTIPEWKAKEREQIRYPEAMKRIIETYKSDISYEGGEYEVIVGNYQERIEKDGRVWADFWVYDRTLDGKDLGNFSIAEFPERLEFDGTGFPERTYFWSALPTTADVGLGS